MGNINISIKADVSQLQKRIKDFKRELANLAQDALLEAADEILVPAMKARLKENRSIFTGDLYSKIEAKPKPIAPGTNPEIVVGAPSSVYAERVEKGSEPHREDVYRILDYVNKKMGITGKEGAILALQILRTIETVGTKPHPFIKPAFEFNKSRFEKTAITKFREKLRSARFTE